MGADAGTGSWADPLLRAEAEARGIAPLEPREVAALPEGARLTHLDALRGMSLDLGMDLRGRGPYADWLRWADRCWHPDGCERKRYEPHPVCLRHLEVDQIDVAVAVRSRADRARLRMADMLEDAVDRLADIMNAGEGEVPAAVRLGAVTALMDRTGLPKQTAAVLDARVEVGAAEDSRAVIAERLDRLAAGAVARAALFPPSGAEADVLEAEVVEDAPPGAA